MSWSNTSWQLCCVKRCHGEHLSSRQRCQCSLSSTSPLDRSGGIAKSFSMPAPNPTRQVVAALPAAGRASLCAHVVVRQNSEDCRFRVSRNTVQSRGHRFLGTDFPILVSEFKFPPRSRIWHASHFSFLDSRCKSKDAHPYMARRERAPYLVVPEIEGPRR